MLLDYRTLATSEAFIRLSKDIAVLFGMNLSIYDPLDITRSMFYCDGCLITSIQEPELAEKAACRVVWASDHTAPRRAVFGGSLLANPLCMFIRRQPRGEARCLACERERFNRVKATRDVVREVCHAGFVDFAFPIIYREQTVAILSTGQLLAEPPGEEAFGRICERLADLRIPQPRLREGYRQARYLEPARVDALQDLLQVYMHHLIDVLLWHRSQERPGREERLRRVLAFMETHLDEDLPLSRVAAIAGYGSHNFSTWFHQCTGSTFSAYLQEKRIAKAQELLTQTQHPIIDIALACGFGSISQFYRAFQNTTGIPPAQYRSSAR
jgi:AraC-like DNA-binding protein